MISCQYVNPKKWGQVHIDQWHAIFCHMLGGKPQVLSEALGSPISGQLSISHTWPGGGRSRAQVYFAWPSWEASPARSNNQGLIKGKNENNVHPKKTNMPPENRPLKKEMPTGSRIIFRVHVSFRGCGCCFNWWFLLFVLLDRVGKTLFISCRSYISHPTAPRCHFEDMLPLLSVGSALNGISMVLRIASMINDRRIKSKTSWGSEAN